MKSPPIDYAKQAVPADYVCRHCGATNCKLWRESGIFDLRLRCINCAGRCEKADVSSIDCAGMVVDRFYHDLSIAHRNCNFGCHVPAIPDQQNWGYWAIGCIPPEAFLWWRRLPSVPQRPGAELCRKTTAG